jgi:succinoglycan biosynthesis protein ExoM
VNQTAMTDARPDLTISIATYDRNDLLGRTIQSCLDQKNALGLRYEIVVTDNHPQALGRDLVEGMAASNAIPIRYIQETARNMSVLRNASIHDARGEFLCFVDDDEFADPNWTDELMGALRRTGADIAVGPRLAEFPFGKPAYDPSGLSFERHADLQPDQFAPLVRADGKPLYGFGTGNSLYRAETCFRDPEPFKIAFGDGHGEDMEFLMRMYREGRTIVWAPKAIVTEEIVAHRLTVPYRFIRATRETQVYVMHYLEHSPNPGRVRLLLTAQGLVQTVMGALLTVATWEFGSKTRIRARRLLIKGLGKLTWKNPVRYIDEDVYKAPAKPQAQS